MSDRKIITEKELNYIETLYLYCNIEDFVSMIKFTDYDINLNNISTNSAYNMMKEYVLPSMFNDENSIGISKGRNWYKFKEYRIGIMPHDMAKNANQFNCIIQYEQNYMFTLKHDLKGIKLPFGGNFKQYHIKRIDITKIAKHKENYMVNHGYISPFRVESNYEGTIYLGNRKNGNVFRMYNKTKELLDTENYKKIELFSEYFGDIENLYTYELELSRAYLKNTLGIETLSDLSKIYKAYKNIVGGIRFYKDTDRNKRLIKNDNRDRVSCKKLTDFVDYERMPKKRYKTSFDYMKKNIISSMDKYIDKSGLDRTNNEYMKIINSLMSERINQNEKDLVITFEDTAQSDAMDKMRAKHILLRDNQSNELEIEANRLFGAIKKEMKK